MKLEELNMSSAYQCEGAALEDGKKASQQDIVNKEFSEKTGFADASAASNHYHKYKDDIKLFNKRIKRSH